MIGRVLGMDPDRLEGGNCCFRVWVFSDTPQLSLRDTFDRPVRRFHGHLAEKHNCTRYECKSRVGEIGYLPPGGFPHLP